MISVDEALTAIESHIPVWQKKSTVLVQDSINQILAEDVTAKRDNPRFDNSAMDGFVLRKTDWEKGLRVFEIVGEIRPESKKPKLEGQGMCLRIMTGAPIPENGDLVIPVEMAIEKNGLVEFSGLPKVNPIRKKGEGYTNGKTVLKKGTVIRPYELGLLIESGNKTCDIFSPVRIALQVTGSEVDGEMNTNGPVLREILGRWPGVTVTELPVLKDEPEEVIKRLSELKKSADLIVTTGGISAGRHDYLYSSLQSLGANYFIRKINLKPGKPVSMAIWDDVVVCNLPGNPVSAVFCADFLLKKVHEKMFGILSQYLVAKLKTPLANRSDRTLFVTGKLEFEQGEIWVHADNRMQSHLMQLYDGHNTYVRLDLGTQYDSGQLVHILPFSG